MRFAVALALAALALCAGSPAFAAPISGAQGPQDSSQAPDRSALAGLYVEESGERIVVEASSGALRLTSGPMTFTLVDIGGGRFRAVERELEFVFAGETVTVLEQGRPAARGVRGAKGPDPVVFQGEHLGQWLDDTVPGLLARYRTPAAAIAYIEQGQIAWVRVYGERRRGEPAGPDTLFNVASLTKPIAAEVLLRLASTGRIDLDAPMAPTWIDPDLADDPRVGRLTARMALHHRTGLPNWRSQTANRLTFSAEPDSGFLYSGEGYTYAARYAERRTGEDFETLAERLVFGPMGMSDASFTIRPSLRTRAAYPHDAQGRELWPVLRLDFSAACCLYATAGDYAAFVVGVMEDPALSPEIRAARFDTSATPRSEMCGGEGRMSLEVCPPRLGWGLGWSVFGFDRETVVTHTGVNDGERAAAFFVPERGVGMVILTNGAGGAKLIRDVTAAAYDNPAYNRIVASFAD